MSLKPYSPCSIRGCPAPAVRGASRCESHERQRKALFDANRGTASQRGYGASTGWPAIRAQVLKENPVCLMGLAGCTGKATDVHHIPDYVIGTNHRDYQLIASCHHCHSFFTMKNWSKRVLRINEATALAILLENEEPDSE